MLRQGRATAASRLARVECWGRPPATGASCDPAVAQTALSGPRLVKPGHGHAIRRGGPGHGIRRGGGACNLGRFVRAAMVLLLVPGLKRRRGYLTVGAGHGGIDPHAAGEPP